MAPPLPRPAWSRQPALLRRIFRDPAPVLDELAGELGPVFALGAGPVRMAVVGDADTLRELFMQPTDRFKWGHKFNVLGFVLGDGSMVVSDGDDHRRRRQAVQPAFGRRRLDGWIPMIVARTDATIDHVAATVGPEGAVIDLLPVGRDLVLDIVVRGLFGDRMAGRAAEIGVLFERPAAYLESPAIRQLPHPLPFTRRARVRDDRRALDALIDAEIAHHRANPVDDPSNVLEVLVADGTLSDAEVRDQVATLIGAGHDTTAASLAWIIWCAALTPGLWERLRDEADRVLGLPSGEEPAPDGSTLAQLDLASRVMREALRLHPAGVLSPREAVVDVDLGGHRIPKGTLVLWSAHLAGRDPSVWDEPLRFDPDRFAGLDDAQRQLTDASWVPFGGGRRNCIGFAAAQMELTLITARLAQRLDVEALAAEAPRPVGMVVNRPEGGAEMRVAARSTSAEP
jgi:cytochrome P450